ncbi:MAG: hypothetical protein AVDCRST_MAG56-3061 [uncultured Cytophagales bacterium]|uniref:Uncharacterized protein n=1 Tax=uncultured Cytophagales bacterium TaxID=158755 RepID=A0A6J4JA92_9SPHI|nr:MAG: hypothetical protein AVDCRST_MAG56-3061 [uncultured Cytophagales bacterium]
MKVNQKRVVFRECRPGFAPFLARPGEARRDLSMEIRHNLASIGMRFVK